ncbi:hypothetical protein P4647_23405 [Peribacillus frigoritolerans]|uniref:hypothetical protein n=1 Tax=Peribacillus frigoritolerans TaxID=450367 RepID=UPI002E1C2683|nr:hypothetical protein [Peribacillus frigoritolerans]
MNVPRNYSEWVVCFEHFKIGEQDELTLQLMEKGTIEWSRGVAERITQQLYETIDDRLRQTADSLQRELDRCNGNETAIVKALLTARKRLTVLQRLSQLQAFPEHVRDSMSNILIEYAKSTQQSLEKSSLTDRTGRLGMLIKNNPLTKFNEDEKIDDIQNNASQQHKNVDGPPNGPKSKRRRIIFP